MHAAPVCEVESIPLPVRIGLALWLAFAQYGEVAFWDIWVQNFRGQAASALSLREGSHHVISPNALKPPCCEEAHAGQKERGGDRDKEKEMPYHPPAV